MLLQSLESRWAVETLREAMGIARSIRRGEPFGSLSKLDRSPVTVGDFAIQALVGRRLEQSFPADPLVGEERSEALRETQGEATLQAVLRAVKPLLPEADALSLFRWIDRGTAEPAGRYWTLDPIDGTKGFLRGGQYAVCLALVENGDVKLGVLGCPELRLLDAGSGCIVVAAAGQGAWYSAWAPSEAWKRLQVSERADIRRAVMLQSLEREHTDTSRAARLREKLGMLAAPLSLDSAAKYALLAAGMGDILLRIPASEGSPYREKIWDIAAGALIVKEAGGRITDIDGRELEFHASRELDRNRGILATNGCLHDAVVETLKRLRKD